MAEQAHTRDHPVRLIVTDDLERSRWTVLVRLLIAIPHYVWLGLWGVVAFFAAVLNWLSALVLGRSPAPLHRFLAAYVKYVTHVYAYVNLVADPFPPFDGRTGYPVEVAIPDPRRQSRLGIFFRGLLALPALLLAGAIFGSPNGTTVPFNRRRTTTDSAGVHHRHFHFTTSTISAGGLVHVVAFLGWFAALALARSPRGLRDAAAWGISYGAQLWAYLFLLTDRYPDSDPLAALRDLPVRQDPITMSVEDDRRRSRLMVFFRLLLWLPHLVWSLLWLLAAFLVTIVNWLATLMLGRSPAPLHRFLAAFVRYQVHVSAFFYLVANPFPGFVGARGSYPIEVTLLEPRRQNRWKVLARLPLGIPALIIAGAYGSIVQLTAFLGWFYALIRGEVPRGLRNAGALGLRYGAQVAGYMMLLTDSYPYAGPTAPGGAADSGDGEELSDDAGPAIAFGASPRSEAGQIDDGSSAATVT
ncbi:MAG TPA: DUF4389 domain-containing protein [Solirubrobacteraceae bacterium]|jgi:hypothetical protein|nr:DUF4389 domain-containing protein [Solirubrobacteraceae bacterium]